MSRNKTLITFDTGNQIKLLSGNKGVRFLLVSGNPIQEPVAWHGPIVMNTNEEIKQAMYELNNGTFIKPVGYIPLSASLQNNLSKYSSNYETSDIVKALRKLKEIEIKQKTSNIDDESELISFIFNVVG